jgi:hypothetical protein
MISGGLFLVTGVGLGVGNSGVGFSAVGCGNLELAAEGRMAGTRIADALMAVA